MRSALKSGLLAITVITAFFTHPAIAGDYSTGDLRIVNPWIKAPLKGAKVAGGYVTITNTGKSADRLTGGMLAAAGRTEIHEMSMESSVMKMKQLENGLEIGPGNTVELKPGSYHLMFMDLGKPLEKGLTVKGSLVFEKAGPVEIEFQIESGMPGKADMHRGSH